ncbi:MAG: nucleotide exchange factor GrpE [Patescibacteria group bacterium]|jgi:molecular chaperone GrpE
MSEDKKAKIKLPLADENTEAVVDTKDEATINLEGWKKALADYHNLQKETDKRMSQLNDFVLSSVVLELLPVFDNYEMALSHVPPEQKNESWVKGLEQTMKLWENFLRDHNIQKIVTLGKNFDPREQEAVGHINDSQQADQIVVQEVQSGYLCQQLVLRPAKVIINNHN